MTNAGSIAWTDLTIDDAEPIRDFYQQVVGWKAEEVSMGDYADYTMVPPHGGPGVAGVCHARGSNANLPPVWLVYVYVEDLDASLAACRDGGGSIVDGPRPLAGGRFAVIKDPAGAMLAIAEPPPK